MAIENDISTILKALVSGRCWPMVAPETPVKPYIIYQVISKVPETNLEGRANLDNLRVQIDLYGESYGSVKTLEASTISAMDAATFTNLPLSSQELYEEETKLYRISMDYSIWS